MEVHLKSTTKIVELEVAGNLVPARIWEGHTENGVPCHAFITRIACAEDADSSQFEAELDSHKPPSVAVRAYDLRYIL